jgi:hypothetical protein
MWYNIAEFLILFSRAALKFNKTKKKKVKVSEKFVWKEKTKQKMQMNDEKGIKKLLQGKLMLL